MTPPPSLSFSVATDRAINVFFVRVCVFVCVRACVRACVRVRAYVQVNTDGEEALPPLHSAALEANLEMVDVLLAAGANPRQMYPF
jgi:hypothetical protein